MVIDQYNVKCFIARQQCCDLSDIFSFFALALLKTPLWQMIDGVTMDVFAIMVVCTLVMIATIQVKL